MTKRKRRKKEKRRSRGKRKLQGPVFFKDPLSDVPREELIPGLINVGKASEIRFHDSLQKTLTLLQSAEPLQTIATLTVYGLFSGITSTGKITPLHKDRRFGQPDVELVQALCLRLPYDAYCGTATNPATIQSLFDALPELGESFSLQRMVTMTEERSDQQKAISFLQEHLRCIRSAFGAGVISIRFSVSSTSCTNRLIMRSSTTSGYPRLR